MQARIGSRPTRFDSKTTALAAALALLGATADLAEASDRSDGSAEVMTVKVEGLPPDTEFAFPVIRVPNGPLELSWYRGDRSPAAPARFPPFLSASPNMLGRSQNSGNAGCRSPRQLRFRRGPLRRTRLQNNRLRLFSTVRRDLARFVRLLSRTNGRKRSLWAVCPDVTARSLTVDPPPRRAGRALVFQCARGISWSARHPNKLKEKIDD